TTLLQNQIYADIESGRGVCIVDPHCDLAISILRLMPKHRTNDVILFDAGDREFAVSFNPLACRDEALIDQVTSGVVSAFKKLHDSWGPRLEDTLRNAVFAIVEHGGTMMELMRLLAERNFRDFIVPKIRDDVVRSFWMHEFASWDDRYRTEAVAAIQNKIRPFLTNRTMRAIVSQPERSLNLREIMDQGKVLIVNLSKGRVGEDNATLLGAFLVTAIQQAAMTRADITEADRRDFYLYIDEFQNFTTSSFASILSEARKYRLSLTIAHQYLKQLDEATSDAVFGNVGSIVAFQVGADDAEPLAEQLSKHPGQLTSQDLTNLSRYTAYARLLIDGMPSNPFSMQSLAPPAVSDDRLAIVSERSRREHAQAFAQIHAAIAGQWQR
ncbi:MAG: type IV secretory system conjugative DNA transfer family protein, partial [Planctomycetaceae bacterium]|nr:type IV secretory system conjugative DNA transfer family protein [Planctomycetaceae bacterium]